MKSRETKQYTTTVIKRAEGSIGNNTTWSWIRVMAQTWRWWRQNAPARPDGGETIRQTQRG